MNLLLDTHTLIWVFEDNATLSKAARDAIIDGGNRVFVSAVSVWEIGIKKALGKLDTPDDLLELVKQHRFTELAINLEHADYVSNLPSIHKDPFDRMLIAQAMVEKLILVTRDGFIPKYDVKCLKA